MRLVQSSVRVQTQRSTRREGTPPQSAKRGRVSTYSQPCNNCRDAAWGWPGGSCGAGGARRGSFGLRELVGPVGLQGSASTSVKCSKEVLRCKDAGECLPSGCKLWVSVASGRNSVDPRSHALLRVENRGVRRTGAFTASGSRPARDAGPDKRSRPTVWPGGCGSGRTATLKRRNVAECVHRQGSAGVILYNHRSGKFFRRGMPSLRDRMRPHRKFAPLTQLVADLAGRQTLAHRGAETVLQAATHRYTHRRSAASAPTARRTNSSRPSPE